MVDVKTIQEFEEYILKVKEKGFDMVVQLKMPNQIEPELIVNYNSSIDTKLEYYKKTYDENLVHKNCKEIQITGVLGLALPTLILNDKED